MVVKATTAGGVIMEWIRGLLKRPLLQQRVGMGMVMLICKRLGECDRRCRVAAAAAVGVCGGVEGMREESKGRRGEAVGSRGLSIALELLASCHGNDGGCSEAGLVVADGKEGKGAEGNGGMARQACGYKNRECESGIAVQKVEPGVNAAKGCAAGRGTMEQRAGCVGTDT